MQKKPTPTERMGNNLLCTYEKSTTEWVIRFIFITGQEMEIDEEDLRKLTEILTQNVPDPTSYSNGWYVLTGVLSYYSDKLWVEANKVRKKMRSRGRYLWYKEHRPSLLKAKGKVSTAIRNGKLVRPDRCEWCGKETYVEAHHPSYAEEDWLNVAWLCRKCHAEVTHASPSMKEKMKNKLQKDVGWVSNQDGRKEDE